MLGGCASGPRISQTQALVDGADAPYGNILVVTLYSRFDSRRYFEDELVRRLRELGVAATASTSMMDTRTPVTRETFVAMAEELDADALLLTQLASLETTGKVVDMSPEATVNLRPTGWYNVFSVDTTEYVEPQAVNFEHSLVLLTDLYSAASRDTVWGIQSAADVSVGFDRLHDFKIVRDEVDAIVRRLRQDGLLAR